MGLKNNEFWWIQYADGRLVQNGRWKDDPVTHELHDGESSKGEVCETGCPNLQYSRKRAKALCWEGDKPVKVRLVKNG